MEGTIPYFKRNFGGSSFMVWGAFSCKGSLPLTFQSTRMTIEKYMGDPVLPENREKRWLFQQDNANVHVSGVTRTWCNENGVGLLRWPACSQGQNPVSTFGDFLSESPVQIINNTSA